MGDVIFIVVGGAIVLLAWIFIPALMIRRNIPKVVRIFQKNNAIGLQNAKTIEELRLKPKSMLQRMYSGQDWKNRALNLLIQTDVVLMTEDGKLYITQESLDSAPWINLRK